ncbi:MAG: glycoside hydrolase family 3 protein [Clostridiales bacterium]|nr:glycoside hydrolase family 3 protein [Clostridiales bacterium]
MKRIILVMLAMLLILSGCSADEVPTANAIKTLSDLTLEEKVGQMIQVERSGLSLSRVEALGIGSVLSGGGSVPGNGSISAWNEMMTEYAEASAGSSSGLPVIYGIDAVHGNNNVPMATIFPHNIGLGAANDPELLRKIGQATAEEMKVIGAHMNFAPAVSVIRDKRWGRTYEGYSEDPKIVSKLGVSYIEGLRDAGIIATAKHFIGDGYVEFGTGEGENLIDRGNVAMPIEDMMAIYSPVYQSAIDSGVDAIMVSFSSVSGEKMHGNEYLLTTVLRDEMNFEGVVISDWEGIYGLHGMLEDQVVKAVNAGIDLLMQPYNGEETYDALLNAVNDGRISEERINEAVSRILDMKGKAGLLDAAPEASEYKLGSDFAIATAREAVAKSQVLLKNEDVLPLKEDQRVYVMGPASDNIGIQSGGWTLEWQGTMTEQFLWGDSILDAFKQTSDFVVDSPTDADVIVLVIGEKPYAEMFGDTDDASLSGPLSLNGNLEAAELAKTYGKPVVTLIVAGRPLEIEEHLNDWDALVMSFLPGTEALGITDVLYSKMPFTGKLPITWPKETSGYDITFMSSDREAEILFPLGYGLEIE